MGRLPDGDEDVARAERTLIEIVLGGLAGGVSAAEREAVPGETEAPEPIV
jgi:hypothetical protein